MNMAVMRTVAKTLSSLRVWKRVSLLWHAVLLRPLLEGSFCRRLRPTDRSAT